MKSKFIVILLALFPIIIVGQNVEWGKVNPDELKSEYCSFDSNALASILYDHIVLKYDMVGSDLRLITERHIRFKVYTSTTNLVSDLTNYIIIFHHNDGIVDIEANTYNMDDAGNVDTSHLGKTSIITEDIKKDIRAAMHIYFPNIRKGSVFECRYKLVSSDLLGFPDWYFQCMYPTQYSEFEAFIPDFLQFNILLDNTKKIDIKIEEPCDQTLSWNAFSNFSSGKMFSSKGKHLRYAKVNIPGIQGEPYMNSMNDYYARLLFQITSFSFPGKPLCKIATNWNEFEMFMFDKNLNNYPFDFHIGISLRKEVEAIIQGEKDTLEIIRKIHHFLISNVRWDNNYNYVQKHTVNEIFDSKSGTSGEINVVFLSMLQKAGIRCWPALTGTRDEGSVQNVSPNWNQFNHLIIIAKVDSSDLVLNAFHPEMSCFLLPSEFINQKAWVLSKPNYWVELKGLSDSKFIAITTASINQAGSLSGKTELQLTGYHGVNYRSKLLNVNDTKSIFEPYFPVSSIDSVILSNESLPDLPLKICIWFNIVSYTQENTNFSILGLNPAKFRSENPFTTENRKYPVYFDHPTDYTSIVNLSIPEKYLIENIPKQVAFIIPDKSGFYSYKCGFSNGILQTITKYRIENVRYDSNLYQHIRNLFIQISQNENNFVILKNK